MAWRRVFTAVGSHREPVLTAEKRRSSDPARSHRPTPSRDVAGHFTLDGFMLPISLSVPSRSPPAIVHAADQQSSFLTLLE
jgi:hypothetical protein